MICQNTVEGGPSGFATVTSSGVKSCLAILYNLEKLDLYLKILTKLLFKALCPDDKICAAMGVRSVVAPTLNALFYAVKGVYSALGSLGDVMLRYLSSLAKINNRVGVPSARGLGCDDLNFEWSIVCAILPGLMGIWQKRMESCARWSNTQIKVAQPRSTSRWDTVQLVSTQGA